MQSLLERYVVSEPPSEVAGEGLKSVPSLP